MKLTCFPYELKLKYPFGISHTTRTSTAIVIVKLEHNGLIGYGEASLPPYLEETQKSVIEFLTSIKLDKYQNPVLEMDKILDDINLLSDKNNHAKAAFDIALHDIVCKTLQIPLYNFVNTANLPNAINSCTIGIDSLEIIEKKIIEAEEFKFLKIKLGSENDFEIIKTIRKLTKKPLYIDANQGWEDKYKALDTIQMLYENNAVVIEQPMPIAKKDEMAWLSASSRIPLLADESFKRLENLDEVSNLFHGINIKLMKCTGIREARKIIEVARVKNMKIMMGCMNESGCATKAAAHLAPLTDYVDLDGPYLITNNPFSGFEMLNGEIILSDNSGIGVNPNIGI
jgi:L-Ala-D/L-Glu epimerase